MPGFYMKRNFGLKWVNRKKRSIRKFLQRRNQDPVNICDGGLNSL